MSQRRGLESLILLSVFTSSACGGIDEDAPIAWALNFADVTVNDEGISGDHMWNFYKKGWEKNQGTEGLACEVLQSLEGSSIVVEGCTAAYSIDLVTTESDCPESITNAPLLVDTLTAFCGGPITEHAKDESPWPGASMGWAIRIGESTDFVEHGYLFAAGLDDGSDVEAGWTSGQDYLLWPTWAWSM